VLNLAACSSSTPLKTTNDAAVASDLGAEISTARDASLEVAGPDVVSADLPLTDASLVTQDTTVDFLPIEDAPQSDLLPIKDVFTTDLAIFSLDAPWIDVPVADVPSAEVVATTDLVFRDGATDGPPLPCASGGDRNCNDNPIVSSIWGTCQPDGTCACTAGHVVNPSTGRCTMASD
jgi:hypothetical protein